MDRSRFAFEPFRLDVSDARLWRGSEVVPLTPKSFSVLTALVEQAGELVTKDRLLDTVWPSTHVGDDVLKTCVREIRRALGDDARHPRFVETVHRRGYRFIALPASATRAASSPAIASPGALLGRDEPLAELTDLFERARDGMRQVAFVVGEAGIGKTSLVTALAHRLGDDGARHVTGQCIEPYGSGEAYLPILAALGDLTVADEAARATLRRNAPTWLSRMPWLSDEGASAEAAVEDPGPSRDRMLREVAVLLEALSKDRPLLVVLDDLHWSDPSTIDVISLLARRSSAAKLLLVGTYRPAEAAIRGPALLDVARDLRGHGLCSQIQLRRLDAEDIGALVEGRAGGPAPPGLVDALGRRTAGNPLFLVSVLDELRRSGALVHEHGRLSLTAPVEAIEDAVPDDLRDLIALQLERLAGEDLRTLEAASLIGGSFDAAAIGATLGREPDDVEARLESLADHDAILAADRGYEFTHALHETVLRERLSPTRRCRWHARIADHLEAQGAPPGRIAHHLRHASKGPLSPKAVAYAITAASKAEEMRAYAEAAGHQRVALSGDRLGAHERIEILLGLGGNEMRAGRSAIARESHLEAARLARATDDAEALARAACGIGAAHQPTGHLDTSLVSLLEEALAALEKRAPRLRAMCLARLAYAIYPDSSSAARRRALVDEALRLARADGSLECLAWVLQYSRWALWSPDNLEERRNSVEELVRVAERLGEGDRQVMAHASRLIDALEAGDLATVDAEIEAFARLADESRQPWFVWSVLRFRALRASIDGRLAEAEQLAAESLAIGRPLEFADAETLYGAQLAILRTLQGRAGEFEEIIRALKDAQPAVSAWRCMLAYIFVQGGRLDEASAELEELASAGLATLPRDNVWLGSLSLLAEVIAAVDDRPRARELHAIMAPYDGRWVVFSFGVATRGAVARYLGLLAATAGRSRVAERHLARALEVHDRAGAHPWSALTRYDLARVLLRAGARARRRERAVALMAEGRTLADELGMKDLARRFRSLRDDA